MERYLLHPAVGVGAAALFIGHLGMFILPSTIAGLSTPILLILGMAGSVAAAIRWL